MITQVRSAPAWWLAAVLGIAGIALAALAPPADQSIIAGIVAIVLLIGLAVALYNRLDGEGWATPAPTSRAAAP